MNDHTASQVIAWLAQIMPETVKFEVSSYVLIVALLALWIWRRPPNRR